MLQNESNNATLTLKISNNDYYIGIKISHIRYL
jgi:hypothetical protein